MKTLKALINYLQMTSDISNDILDTPLVGLFLDSRQVIEDSVFIAIQGHAHHGLDFYQKAIEQGAVVILSDRALTTADQQNILVIDNLQQKLAQLAKWFYDNPSQRLKLIGITGTNGKTSTAHYLAQILNRNAKVAILGTLGNGVLGQLKPSANTTLESLALNHQLHEFVKQQVEYVVMEVSSHAVALGRIEGLSFEVLALTQVTRDHLDFHKTEEAYRDTKKALFINYPANFWVLNQEDSLGQSLYLHSPEQVKIGYAKQQNGEGSTLFFEQLNYDAQGFNGFLKYQDSKSLVKTSLMGAFNVENLLCALGICQALRVDWQEISDCVGELKSVVGRMEPVSYHPSVMIDYAHTPDALEAILRAVRQHLNHPSAKLWVVFGCGGDRDQGKRPLMGRVAEQYADQVVVTDDNPRYEDPKTIVEQILQGMTHSPLVIHNRSQAIGHAVTEAHPQDIVVVAGKGHEDYQDIQGVKYPMKDAEMILNAVQS